MRWRGHGKTIVVPAICAMQLSVALGCGSSTDLLVSYAAAPNNLYTTLRSVEVHPQYGNPAAQLAVAVSAQANAVRVDYTQEYGEAYYDAFFAAAKANGLSVMEITPYLHTNGTFAQQLVYTPTAYAAYVGAEAAKRCGSVPTLLIEIYNEPDAANSQALMTTTQYVAMVQATAPAVRAACPSAVLITGGTSGLDLGWDAAVAAVAPLVDGFGLHPYGVNTGEMRSAVTAVQAAFGVSKPVYFTEFGTALAGFEDAAGATPFWNTYQDNLVGSGFSYAGSY